MASAAASTLTKVQGAVLQHARQGASLAEQQYAKLMASNARYVLKDKAAVDLMPKQYFFTKLSELPVRYKHAMSEAEVVKAKWATRGELTGAELGVAAAFGAEVFAWFCVGEIIGRGGTLLDYSV